MSTLNWSVIIYVVFIDFLAIMSPGPDFFMVLKNSLNKSHKAGVYTTLGISLGCFILFLLGVLGVGALIATNKILFTALKFAGALYLVYLAIKSLTGNTTVKEPQLVYNDDTKISFGEYFKIGLVCNLTNPKAMMFIITLATYIAEKGNPYTDGIFVTFVTCLNTFIWFSLVSIIFGSVKVRKIFYRYQRVINILFAIVLLYMAGKILFL